MSDVELHMDLLDALEQIRKLRLKLAITEAELFQANYKNWVLSERLNRKNTMVAKKVKGVVW